MEQSEGQKESPSGSPFEMSKDGHLAWDCGESYREDGGGTCCSHLLLLGLWFYIFHLDWLEDSFIHLTRFSWGVNSPPEVNEILLGIQSVCEATRVPFPALQQQFTKWYPGDLGSECASVKGLPSHPGMHCQSPPPFPSPAVQGQLRVEKGERGLLCPSVPITLSCWAAVPVEDKPR